MSLTRLRRIGLPIVAAIAVSAAVAAPATAATGAALGAGTFTSWQKAQTAAGFVLERPTATYGLRNVGHIIVSFCEVANGAHKRIVSVGYGTFKTKSLSLSQDDANGPCGDGYAGTELGSYRIHGIKAQLWGYCGFDDLPACSSTKIELWLTWQHKADYYTASSYNEARSRLLHFASTLKQV
jgi:hypothetical protein